MKVSIIIPSYDMFSWGANFLDYSLEILKKQTYKDFGVIIPNLSTNDRIEKVAKEARKELNITHIKNNTKGASTNINLGVKNSKGEIIKILCQDDYLLTETSLQEIVNGFSSTYLCWLVTPYVHTRNRTQYFNLHTPAVSADLYLNNTIGTPSCLAFLNEEPLEFDDRLFWFMDCDYYYRLYKRYGNPIILEKPNFAQFLWSGQGTNAVVNTNIVEQEKQYLEGKYAF